MPGCRLKTLVVLGCLLIPPIASAQKELASESQVVAGMVVKLARFVTWPSESTAAWGASFQLCVTGDDRILAHLEAVAPNERIGSMPIQVRRVNKYREALGCHVLFTGPGSDPRFSTLSEPALTVSMEQGYADAGGIVELAIIQGKVSFQINTRAAERARLQISSRLLALARTMQK